MKKLLFLAILIPGLALATTQQNLGGSLLAEIEPMYPGPQETVTVRLGGFQLDLDRSNIQWLIDGQLVKNGLGVKEYSAKVGNLGKTSIWRIVATEQSGKRIEKIITFKPARVDLLWQADTYTPALYQGKALPTNESEITVVAMPEMLDEKGNHYDPTKLIYRWEKDSNFMKSQSGTGKHTFSFKADKIFGSNTVKVLVSTQDNTIQAEAETRIQIRAPFINLYYYDPLVGPNYNQALGSKININQGLVSMIAEPFFFNRSSLENNLLDLTWLVNNKPIKLADPKSRKVTFEAGDKLGSVNLSIKAVDQENSLQNSSLETVINVLDQNTNDTF